MMRLFLLFAFLFCFKSAFSQPPAKNVLYLNSYNIGYGWSDSIAKGIRKALNQQNINLYTECLDAKRFGQNHFETFKSYLQNKYDSLSFDLVITSDNDALDFVVKYEPILFPKLKVVFCGINNPGDYNLQGSNKYGYVENSNAEKAISVLSKIIPEAKSLLFITDNTTSGLIIVNEFETLQSRFPSLKLNFISEIDREEVVKTLQKGDKGDMVYVMGINRDKHGNVVDYIDFYKEISQISSKPVFVDDESTIGLNVVGGNANRGFSHGFQSGLLALKLIQDSTGSDIFHINTIKDEYIFDYKQLKKFGIKSRNLPPGSVIINKPIVQYLRYIIILLIAVGVLAAIVVFLIILNRKRINAEKKVKEQLSVINDRNSQLEKSYIQVSDLNCELEEANAQLINLNKSLEEAKLKAEESERLKSSFLANLSHEIRTPLNAILGFSSLLTDTKLKENVKEHYSKIIQSNSDSLLVLIDDILDFSKIEAGQVKINIEPVLVNDIFAELFEFFKQKSSDQLKFIISEKALKSQVLIHTDKIRFRQILNNLLTNAFKFTEKGYIEMGYGIADSSQIMFYVKDTGIGIDPKYHKTIFERFRKLEDENTRYYSGSGLGLAICKKLTDLLGGKIWVEGEPDIGSIFYFTHPDYSFLNTSPTWNLQSKPIPEYNWKGVRIAIAEDEENNFMLLQQVLKKQGAEVIWFKDGADIIHYFKETKDHQVKVILMDIKMPVIDGYQALAEIRKLFPALPVVAQTAYAMSEDIEKMKKKGFNDYITKPVMVDVLKEKIDRFLG